MAWAKYTQLQILENEESTDGHEQAGGDAESAPVKADSSAKDEEDGDEESAMYDEAPRSPGGGTTPRSRARTETKGTVSGTSNKINTKDTEQQWEWRQRQVFRSSPQEDHCQRHSDRQDPWSGEHQKEKHE